MKNLCSKMLMFALIVGVTFLAYAGRDYDDDGPLVATTSTKKSKAKVRAFASVSGGSYKWDSGTWTLTAYVPNQTTKGSPYESNSVQFNSYLYESNYHRGRGQLSQAYADAYCNATTMRGGQHEVHANC